MTVTASTIATVTWRALDREGEDTCRLSQAEHGWLLVGHARFRDDLGFAALDYVVRCDDGWGTLSANVAGDHGGREVQLRIWHDTGRWWLNDVEQPQVTGAGDVDLSFTPATNLMPMRRLQASREIAQDVTAAWLRYPEPGLHRLDQTYRRTGLPDVVSYSAQQTGFATDMSVDVSGFVTLYPEFWEGEMTHED